MRASRSLAVLIKCKLLSGCACSGRGPVPLGPSWALASTQLPLARAATAGLLASWPMGQSLGAGLTAHLDGPMPIACLRTRRLGGAVFLFKKVFSVVLHANANLHANLHNLRLSNLTPSRLASLEAACPPPMSWADHHSPAMHIKNVVLPKTSFYGLNDAGNYCICSHLKTPFHCTMS